MTDQYEIHVLPPEQVLFSRGNGGVFQGVLEGKAYNELTVYRTFPFRYPSQFISIRDMEGKELGVIEDIARLDQESRDELEAELQYRYFLPRVIRVDRVKQKTDLWLWELQTTLGPTKMAMRNLHEHLQFPDGNRIILTDLNGKRCEIEDWRALDSHSQRELTDVV